MQKEVVTMQAELGMLKMVAEIWILGGVAWWCLFGIFSSKPYFLD